MDLGIVEGLNAFELMLLVTDLVAKNSSLLYMLLLNNGLEMILLFIDNLVDAN